MSVAQKLYEGINIGTETTGLITYMRTDSERMSPMFTDECFKYLIDYIKPGMTEKQIAREIQNYYMDHADGIAFEPIVVLK